MANQLAEFLEERKSRVPELNWEAKKKDWLDAVSRLYAKIEGLLQPSIHKGVVTIDDSHRIDITEDFIGAYDVPELRLTVGQDRVSFKPVGINVVGALGRIDMSGDRDKISLIWTGGPGDWQFVVQRLPDLVLVPLEEESLLAALKRVMQP